MKRSFVVVLTLLIFLLFISDIEAQTMNDYCQYPPFVGITVQPNILFVIDASGSMDWNAYNFGGRTYDPDTSYEGYFTPSKSYKLEDGIYEETIPTGQPCQCSCVRWRCRNWNWGGCVWRGGGCRRWGCCVEE